MVHEGADGGEASGLQDAGEVGGAAGVRAREVDLLGGGRPAGGREVRLERQDLEDFGWTVGCRKCDQMRSGIAISTMSCGCDKIVSA